MPIFLKNTLRYTTADHSVLCVHLFALPISFYHIRLQHYLSAWSAFWLSSSLASTVLSHTLSLCLCRSASVTSRHPHKFIQWELFSLDIKIFVYFLLCCTHTHTYSLPLTHPRLLLLPINFCCSCFRRRSALTTRRRDVAASSRMCCVFCVCVCARCRRRRCRCRCVFFVVASSSSRACCCCMQGRLRTNFNIIWRSSFAHSAAAFARSLAVCVSFVCSLSFSLACFECSLLFDFSCRLASWVRVVVPAKNKWCALVETGQQVWNEYN